MWLLFLLAITSYSIILIAFDNSGKLCQKIFYLFFRKKQCLNSFAKPGIAYNAYNFTQQNYPQGARRSLWIVESTDANTKKRED